MRSLVYEHVGTKYKLEYPTTILACIAACVTIPIYVFYWYGPQIRERSKFAQTLESDRQARGGHEPVAHKGVDEKGPEHV